MYTNDQVLAAISKALAEKGERKFTQSVELSVNFKSIDFSKSENKLNLDVLLPKGRGKKVNIIVFADGNLAADAKNAGADIIVGSDQIAGYDKGAIKKATRNSEFFAQPQLMIHVGKNFGQILGGRGKVPKPLVGNVAGMLKNARDTVKVRTRGRNLPVVHCAIGTEAMSPEDIAANANAVLSAIINKLGDHTLKSAYVKLSMGKPFPIEGISSPGSA